MKKIELELTKDEEFYLRSEMDMLLRAYKRNYAVQQYDNDTMGEVFNKVYKALTGEDHSRYSEVKKYEQIKTIATENANKNGYLVDIKL